jgi:hypothetical protein
MNAEIFAEWLRRQGYRVVRTASSYWYETSSRVYQAFPYHWVINPEEKELRELLWQKRGIALRYSTRVDAPKGKLSYHVVWDGLRYELSELPRRARQNVRKGLRYASIEPISMSWLATEGWLLREEVLDRQGRARAEDAAWWRDLCECTEALPGFEAWGAIHEGKLVGSMLTLVCDGCCLFLYQQSSTECLKYRVNNSLFYTITAAVLERPEVSSVFLGLHSLDAPESVDEFKFRMGYRPRPVRQRVVFHPGLSPVFNAGSHRLINRLVERYPERPALSKLEGMVRFYLEGKRPLDHQRWPERLMPRQSELLEAQ